MFPARVTRVVWPKLIKDGFEGYRIVELLPLKVTEKGDFFESTEALLAIDNVKTAVNDLVICGIGSRLREILTEEGLPYKAFVLGIIDSFDLC